MSAKAPAGRAKRKMGSALATCTSDTIKADGLRLVISQPEAALYIQFPTFETTVAVQTIAKAVSRKGASGLSEFCLPAPWAVTTNSWAFACPCNASRDAVGAPACPPVQAWLEK